MIKQTQLSHLAAIAADIAKVKAALAKLNAEYNDVEAPVMAGLLADKPVVVEPGEYSVEVDWESKRNVSWKNVVIARLGEKVAEKVLADTPPTRTPFIVLKKTVNVAETVSA